MTGVILVSCVEYLGGGGRVSNGTDLIYLMFSKADVETFCAAHKEQASFFVKIYAVWRDKTITSGDLKCRGNHKNCNVCYRKEDGQN